MKNRIGFKQPLIAVMVIILAMAFGSVVFGWTFPTANPPGNTTDPNSIGVFIAKKNPALGKTDRFLGVNQLNPLEKLHLSDGSLQVGGTVEAVANRIFSLQAESVSVENATFSRGISAKGGLVVNGNTLFNGDVAVSGIPSPGISLNVHGDVSKGGGSFEIDHPLDPLNKILRHSFVESPDMKNIYDGIATLDAHGEAVVELPAYFEALNRDYRYQLMPLGVPASGLYVKEKIKNNRFTIAGGAPHGKVSWQVTGIRQDTYAREHPIVAEEEKATPGYLYPELYAK